MKKVTVFLIATLLMAVTIGCEKVSQDDQKIRITVEPTYYTLDFQTDKKAAMAPIGWPDLIHDAYDYAGHGTVDLWTNNYSTHVIGFTWNYPEFLTDQTVLLDPGGYTAQGWLSNNYQYYAGGLSDGIIGWIVNTSWKTWDGTPNLDSAIIDPLNTIITVELLPQGHCFAFKDVGNNIDRIGQAGVNEGLTKDQMSVYIPPNPLLEDTVWYCYGSDLQLWIHTKDGSRYTLDFETYLIALPTEEKELTGTGGGSQQTPFVVYCDFPAIPPVSNQITASFAIAGYVPYSEVIIDPS